MINQIRLLYTTLDWWSEDATWREDWFYLLTVRHLELWYTKRIARAQTVGWVHEIFDRSSPSSEESF